MNAGSTADPRFDPEIFELIPHRPPMLLINTIEAVSAQASRAIVQIDEHATFFQKDAGVPSWIGLEYMGQTAALIAGYQLREGLTEPHLGFLMGCRNYQVWQEYFKPATKLLVSCTQAAIVGKSLATFNCTIQDDSSKQEIAHASLSVFRKSNTQLQDR